MCRQTSPDVYLGGPLVLALAMGVSVKQSMTYRRALIEKLAARDAGEGD
jgi:hypothetical protein